MKRKFEILRQTVDEFAQQDEFPMLVVAVRSGELAYVLKFLQDGRIEGVLPRFDHEGAVLRLGDSQNRPQQPSPGAGDQNQRRLSIRL